MDIRHDDSMYNSLVAEFVRQEHQVMVVAASRENKPTRIEVEGGVAVLRVRTLPLFNVHPVLKGLANLLLPFQYRLALSRHLSDRQFGLIITPTPPITLTSLAGRLKKRHRARFLLILRDIFPQNAVDLGLMKQGSLLYKHFRRVEKRLYALADAIGCMSQGNIDYVRKVNPEVGPDKLHLLPNWIKPSPISVEGGGDILEKYGLNGKFVVVFGGNLGLPQKVDNIVDLCRIHSDKPDLVFLVVGKGTHKAYLQKLVETSGLRNVLVLDHMPRRDYERLVAHSDIGLVSLSERFTIPNIPSRNLSYYNCRIPVFAIVDGATDYGRMLEEDQAGLFCRHGDYHAYKTLFDRLYYDADLRRRMGQNGYDALVAKYNPDVTYKRIASILGFS